MGEIGHKRPVLLGFARFKEISVCTEVTYHCKRGIIREGEDPSKLGDLTPFGKISRNYGNPLKKGGLTIYRGEVDRCARDSKHKFVA